MYQGECKNHIVPAFAIGKPFWNLHDYNYLEMM